jgi:hypothetical protein
MKKLLLLLLTSNAFAHDYVDIEINTTIRNNRMMERRILRDAELYGNWYDRQESREFVREEERYNRSLKREIIYDEIKLWNGYYR